MMKLVDNEWQQLSGIPLYYRVSDENGPLIFHSDQDYLCYLKLLKEMASRYLVSIHAYTLLPNQVHILASQYLSYASVSVMLKLVHRAYSEYYFHSYDSSISLILSQGQYSPVEANDYALAVTLYIEQLATSQHQASSKRDNTALTNRVGLEQVDINLSRWPGNHQHAQKLLLEFEGGLESRPVIGSSLFKHRMALRAELPGIMYCHSTQKSPISSGVGRYTKKEYPAMGYYLDELD